MIEGVFYYDFGLIHNAARDRQIISQAMQHWMDNTCIIFRPKVPSDIYSIYIMQDSGLVKLQSIT